MGEGATILPHRVLNLLGDFLRIATIAETNDRHYDLIHGLTSPKDHQRATRG